MVRFALSYGAVFIIFAVLDFLWLSNMAGRIYRPMMGDLLLEKFNVPPAVLFYILYVFGLTWFAVYPAVSGQLNPYNLSPLMSAVAGGFVVGLIGYGTYNLTALAVVRNWSAPLSYIDIGWGAIASAVASGIAFLCLRLLK
ncbi:DUF2177 family protein [Asticcacaulis machinosus]|uniref:DUF2177 family protein n=1 Tax=Asticcacaulis machinosus TaxID=2984211 RepID=A0ABT5HNA5_9CAUL|nr:DUF2177 family protein [Asticcacaulis machinosus]MDC7677620.1 DUF2177 family protein [Asticcacaulis machinosus]